VSKPENPIAFPNKSVFFEKGVHGSLQPVEVYGDGMTLLDYFAGQALAAYSATPIIFQDATKEQVAKWCYDTAEAMLAERKNYE